jgi:hypothetical protein
MHFESRQSNFSRYPPYAHGGMYVVSRDVMFYIARNEPDFARGTINRCIAQYCEETDSCNNKRGTLPSLEDVQVALWLLPMLVTSVHDHRLVPMTGCNEQALAVWDVPPDVMREMGQSLRAGERMCSQALFEFNANQVLVSSIHSAFTEDQVHRFPINHQVSHPLTSQITV